MEKYKLKNFLLILPLLFWISSCGNTTTVPSMVSISPTEPLILNVDRRILNGFEEYTIAKPSITFQLRIDNQGNPVPLTIVGVTLVVNGPKGVKVVPVDSTGNIFSFRDASFSIAPRAFFAEVPAYQAGFCMHKVGYFQEPSIATACADIADSKVDTLGVSAVGTTESSDGTSCCPSATADMTNLLLLVGGLQEDDSAEPGLPTQSQPYSITAYIQGIYGTFLQPLANYSTQVFFTARAN